MNIKAWKVCARSSSGQWLYLCESETQGKRMLPNAESLAREFPNRVSAIRAADKIRDSWKGLTNWQAVRGF